MSNTNGMTKEELEALISHEIDFEKLNELCEHITNSIREILNSCGLYFRIFSRVKSVESIASKLLHGKYGTYDNPKNIQDLLGIRVILYYYDDLSICRDIMEGTFKIVDTWSRNTFNANEFRATKINGVFRYPSEYFSLYTKKIWSLPIDTTFEVQFRTVFFEGWHEIEHDIRYKSRLTDEQFWKGSEELSRILNCILANLELSDWSLVQLFEQLSYNQFTNGNWELMLKSKFRIKMDDTEGLNPEIISIFDKNTDVAKQFFKCSRQKLIRELLTLDHPHVSYNLIIGLLNKHIVKNPDIEKICAKINNYNEERLFQKTTLARLESNILFHIELPLLHKETRLLQSEFNNAVLILYRWARFKINPVFEDIPAEPSSYSNKLPGYMLKIVYNPEKMFFSMKLNHIDSKSPGTLWHIHASIAHLNDNLLHFYHMTSRDMPHGVTHFPTFIKPSFMHDLINKVGITDIYKLVCKAHFVTSDAEYNTFNDFTKNEKRALPVVAIVQKNDTINIESDDNNYLEGYDMNSFNINGMRLAKVTGYYSHVYMIDHSFTSKFAYDNNINVSNALGCICIFWPFSSGKTMDIFTQKMVYNTNFDFNRFAFQDKNIYEKAFRHKLVQIIKDDNISR